MVVWYGLVDGGATRICWKNVLTAFYFSDKVTQSKQAEELNDEAE